MCSVRAAEVRRLPGVGGGEQPLLSAERVSARLGEHLALAEASLRVGEGESVTVSGVNGAGKTTLLRVLAGVIPAASGLVLVGDRPVDERDPVVRRRLAALVGPVALAPALTLVEHLELVALSWDVPAEDGRRRGMRVLEAFGAGLLESRFPHELSSGQTQMFALALTLVRPFDVLLLDEPEQRLDTDRVQTLGDLLVRLREEGVALVVTTHSPALADRLGGERLVLHEPDDAG